MRVYEFSKQYNVSNKELIDLLHKNGFEVSSHMSVLSDQARSFLDCHFNKTTSAQNSSSSAEAATMKSTEPIMKKVLDENSTSSKGQNKPVPTMASVNESSLKKTFEKREATVSSKPSEPEIIVQSMTVSDFAQKVNKPVSEIIVTLLKQGVVANKNQIVPENLVIQLAHYFGIKVVQPLAQTSEKIESLVASSIGNAKEPRLPVIVVIGHVDHGKTTLLDFIRKTRVAAKEKGGITQHVGAYEAHTTQGNLVFLDTPGHEAFTMMRVRGLKVADIAILVVAADDGIMPQTVEAIRIAQSVKLPIIVAVNKIDKATPAQIEAVKRGLANYDLLTEEWGGQTVCVPISAKVGTGIENLLEVVVLQAQLMDLTTSTQVPARGFILESKLEKGRGPVATVICQAGILRVGDHFLAGKEQGKVSSLIDSQGNRIKEAYPSQPVQVAGFTALPQVGDTFEVLSPEEIKKRLHTAVTQAPLHARPISENAINIIVKTDGTSSQEALLAALLKISGKNYKPLHVIHTGIGPVLESDILLAHDTGAVIYGLHVKASTGVLQQAQQMGVVIKLFDIIYKLLEEITLFAQEGKPVKKVMRKTGEATVLKVFDIKNLGIVAGAYVREGRFIKDGKVVVWRGKNKIGEGSIKSLQRERKTVKEIHKGFECAFMVDGFTEWHIDDRVECYGEAEG